MAMKLNIRKTLTPILAVAVLAAATPVRADDQHSRRGGNAQAQGGPSPQAAGQAQPRGGFQPRMTAPAPQPAPQAAAQQRSFLPRMATPQPATQQLAPQVRSRQGFPGSNGLAPQAVSRAVGPQAVSPRAIGPQAVAPRAVVGPQGGRVVGQAVPRGSVAPRYAAPVYGGGGGYYSGRYYGYYGHPYYYPSHVVYGRPYYAYPYGYSPYYAFHPHFSIGFGFFVGYPVAYPTWYNPYAVSTFGYGVSYGVSYGGISFDMQPYDAAVFIDGRYVGAAYDFGPQAAPLTLRSGLHHVELHAEGLAPLAFDITVVPGQVIPYQGTMPVVR
jgi:hypothetical protein